jgi:hypothetical protein
MIYLRKLFIALLIIFSSCATYLEIYKDYSSGVLSTDVIDYKADTITLKIKFFMLDNKSGDYITDRNIFHAITIYSSDFNGEIQEISTSEISLDKNYSCAVLLDEIYPLSTYAYPSNSGINNTAEVFIRKFFKNAGDNNSMLFSTFKDNENPLTIVGENYTKVPKEYDLPLADYLNSSTLPCHESNCIDSLPLLKSMDLLMDFIDQKAPAQNRNLLLMYSRNLFNRKGYSINSLIDKAKQHNIKVSSILGSIGNYEIKWDSDGEELYYKMALETGGIVYQVNNYDGKDLNLLASRLGDIFKGNIKYYETVCKITPESWTDPFQPGFYATGDLEFELQNGTEFKIPFGIMIK